MIVPTSHEDLSKNTLVIGSSILTILKYKPILLDDLYKTLEQKYSVLDINLFFNVLTFLFCVEAIELQDLLVRVKSI